MAAAPPTVEEDGTQRITISALRWRSIAARAPQSYLGQASAHPQARGAWRGWHADAGAVWESLGAQSYSHPCSLRASPCWWRRIAGALAMCLGRALGDSNGSHQRAVCHRAG